MQTVEVARFERAGDVRRVLIGEEEGCVVVREDLSGPSTLVAYGDEQRSLRVTFAREAVPALLDALGTVQEGGSLRGYLSCERHDVVDLMDLCDARGVPYAFAGIGPSSGIQFRPAGWSGQGGRAGTPLE